MRVLIQWARQDPQAWETHEISRVQDWRALPSKPMPVDLTAPVDNQPGWINAMCVQGLVFEKADRYSIQAAAGGGIQVFSMFDHPVDNPPGQRHGHVWTIRDPAPDPALPVLSAVRQVSTGRVRLYDRFIDQVPVGFEVSIDPLEIQLWAPKQVGLIGGLVYRVNTRQSVQWYAEPSSVVAANLNEAGTPHLPWSQYPTPAANTQRFGKWLTYEKFREHMDKVRPLPSWEEWL